MAAVSSVRSGRQLDSALIRSYPMFEYVATNEVVINISPPAENFVVQHFNLSESTIIKTIVPPPHPTFFAINQSGQTGLFDGAGTKVFPSNRATVVGLQRWGLCLCEAGELLLQ